jgi:uncharacterized glyoxalase superfamily protein PhnB
MAVHDFAIIPHLSVRNAAAAIEFYKNYFGFEEVQRLLMPNGSIMHCELQRNGQPLLLGEEPTAEMAPGHCRSPQSLGGSAVTLHLNVPDVDAAFARAISGGAKPLMPVTDMFWGDRYGKLVDPFGHVWSLATHKEDVPPSEIQSRFNAFLAKWKK